MALTLPYPSQPATNSALASAPVLANITAIAQAIQAFDGSQINAGTVTAAALKTSINPNTIMNATIQPFVQSGCAWSIVSGLQGTMSGGTIFVGPSGSIYQVTVNGIGSYTFTASKDTYIDIDYNGNVYYSAVANNAASPAITANALRVAIVVTSASAITFVNQGQLDTNLGGFAPTISGVFITHADSLGNIIYPTDPNGKLLCWRQNYTTFNTGNTTDTQIPGLSAPVNILNTSRKIKLSIFTPYLYGTAAGVRGNLTIYDGTPGSGTRLAAGHGMANSSASAGIGWAQTIRNPSATGLKTYNGGLCTNPTNTATVDIDLLSPLSLWVELE